MTITPGTLRHEQILGAPVVFERMPEGCGYSEDQRWAYTCSDWPHKIAGYARTLADARFAARDDLRNHRHGELARPDSAYTLHLEVVEADGRTWETAVQHATPAAALRDLMAASSKAQYRWITNPRGHIVAERIENEVPTGSLVSHWLAGFSTTTAPSSVTARLEFLR